MRTLFLPLLLLTTLLFVACSTSDDDDSAQNQPDNDQTADDDLNDDAGDDALDDDGGDDNLNDDADDDMDDDIADADASDDDITDDDDTDDDAADDDIADDDSLPDNMYVSAVFNDIHDDFIFCDRLNHNWICEDRKLPSAPELKGSSVIDYDLYYSGHINGSSFWGVSLYIYFAPDSSIMEFYSAIVQYTPSDGWVIWNALPYLMGYTISPLSVDDWYYSRYYDYPAHPKKLYVRQGQSVSEVELPYPMSIYGMYFRKEGQGVISGWRTDDMTTVLLKINDGQFSTIDMPPILNQSTFYYMYFDDEGDGWLIKNHDDATIDPTLYRLIGDQLEAVEIPVGCEDATPRALDFFDNSYGVVTTDTNKYWLYHNDAWSCKEIPAVKNKNGKLNYTKLYVNVLAPGYYLIWSGQEGNPALFEYVNGEVKPIDLPIELDVMQIVYAMYF